MNEFVNDSAMPFIDSLSEEKLKQLEGFKLPNGFKFTSTLDENIDKRLSVIEYNINDMLYTLKRIEKKINKLRESHD